MKTSSSRRRARALCVALVLAALVAGHWWWWYAPRARAAAPAASGAPWALLVDGGFDTALWVPFPHQNLGAVGVDDPRATLAAAARLYRRDPLVLPRFGPFRVPPARELTAAWSAGGRRFAIAARVYPSFALVARLAGKIAGNPWLAGGVVEGPYGRVSVRWDGLTWIASGGGASWQAVDRAGARPPPAALAWAQLGGAGGVVPAGFYRLSAEGTAVTVDRVASLAAPPRSERLFAPPLLDPGLLSGSPPAALLGIAADEGARRALVIFEGPSFALLDAASTIEGSVAEEPADDLPLAGMGLALLLGEDGYRGSSGDWSLIAGGEQPYRRALELVPAVDSAFARAAAGGEQRLVAAVTLAPAATVAALAEAARLLASGSAARAMLGSSIEASAADPARRVADLELLLAPLARFDRGSVVILRAPTRVHLRLESATASR